MKHDETRGGRAAELLAAESLRTRGVQTPALPPAVTYAFGGVPAMQ